jgi:FMN phosphatase YigB (HAD superfamily)
LKDCQEQSEYAETNQQRDAMSTQEYFLLRAMTGWQEVELNDISLPPAPKDSLHSLEETLQHLEGISTVTLDIFDTLLRRDVEPCFYPTRAAMQQLSFFLARTGIILNVDELLNLRHEAETLARQSALAHGNDPECTLSDIFTQLYQLIKSRYQLDPESLIPHQRLVDFEVKVETERLSPMPGAISLLQELKHRGIKTLLLSDMHLETLHIEYILRHHDLHHYIDKVYVSCDTRCSKGSGNLFAHLISSGELIPENTLHIGDHTISDFQRPREHGIRALLFHSNEERERRYRLDQALRLAKVYGDSSHIWNLSSTAHHNSHSPYQIGYQRLGPIFTLFALDILVKTLRESYRDVFFLARDGYLLQKLYEQLRSQLLISQLLHPPAGKYLYISRASTQTERTKEGAYKNTSRLQDYLVQEKFFGTGKILLVDIGWNGSILANLEKTFGDLTTFPQIDACFFGRQYGEPLEKINLGPGFAYDGIRHNPIEHLINECRELFETATASFEGSVLGYSSTSNRIAPYCADSTLSRTDRELITQVQQGILAYCDNFVEMYNRFTPPPDALHYDAILNATSLIAGTYSCEQEIIAGLKLDLGIGYEERISMGTFLGLNNRIKSPPHFIPSIKLELIADENSNHQGPQKLFEKIHEMTQRLQQQEKLILYGVGTISSLLAPLLLDKIDYFVDGNSALHNQLFLGKPIKPPEVLFTETDHSIFVTPLNRKNVIMKRMAGCSLPTYYIDDFL